MDYILCIIINKSSDLFSLIFPLNNTYGLGWLLIETSKTSCLLPPSWILSPFVFFFVNHSFYKALFYCCCGVVNWKQTINLVVFDEWRYNSNQFSVQLHKQWWQAFDRKKAVCELKLRQVGRDRKITRSHTHCADSVCDCWSDSDRWRLFLVAGCWLVGESVDSRSVSWLAVRCLLAVAVLYPLLFLL